MKKFTFSMLVVALAAPMMFNSCKGGDGDDPKTDPTDLPVPPKAAEAIKVVINPPATQPIKDYPVSFEFTETGVGIVGFMAPTVQSNAPVKSQVASEAYYITGSASKSGNVYTVTGPNGKTYKFEITQSVPQVTIKYMDPEGGSLDLMGKLQAVVMTNQFFTNLCRSWSVVKTRITIVADGVNVVADWPNPTCSAPCDLNEIEKFAKKYYTITDKLPEGMSVSSVNISNRGTYNISFANKTEYVGEWTSALSNGFNYSWKNSDMGFQLENGKAVFEFVADSGVTYCTMTLSAVIKDGNKDFDTKVFCTMKQK